MRSGPRRFRNLRPIRRDNPDLRGIRAHHGLHRAQRFLRRERRQSGRRQPLLHRWARRHSDLRPGAPVDAERRPPQAAPFMGDDIEDRVGCGIVRLPRRAQQGRRRRKHDEPVERIGAGQPIEILRPADLRSQNPFETGPILRGERGIVDDARRVNDATQRRPGRAPFGKESVKRISVADIDRRDAHLRRPRRPTAAGCWTHPGYRPRGVRQAKYVSRRARPAIPPPARPRPDRPPVTRYWPSGRTSGAGVVRRCETTILPICRALHHVAEGGRGIFEREGRDGQRGQSSVGQIRHETREELRDPFRLPFRGVAKINDVIVDSRARACDLLCGPDAALADLDEPSAPSRGPEARVDERSAQRVEHDIDAPAVGQPRDLGVERVVARIENMMDAERAKASALDLASRGGEDFRAGPQRQMNRGKTDAAGRRVDQHAIRTLSAGPPLRARSPRSDRQSGGPRLPRR